MRQLGANQCAAEEPDRDEQRRGNVHVSLPVVFQNAQSSYRKEKCGERRSDGGDRSEPRQKNQRGDDDDTSANSKEARENAAAESDGDEYEYHDYILPVGTAQSSEVPSPKTRGGMIHRVLARFLVLIHVAYVAFVVLGSLMVLRWPGLIWFHLAAVAWAFGTLAFDLGCPLTPSEKASWRRGGIEPYPEGFLQHHVLRIRFSAEHSRRNHTIIGLLVVAFNAAVYWAVFFRP